MERTGPKKKLNETSAQLKQQNIETVMTTVFYSTYYKDIVKFAGLGHKKLV